MSASFNVSSVSISKHIVRVQLQKHALIGLNVETEPFLSVFEPIGSTHIFEAVRVLCFEISPNSLTTRVKIESLHSH